MSKRLFAKLLNCENGNEVKIHFDSDLREYTATKNGDQKSAYFTDDKEDAMHTAKAMLR